MKVLAFMGLYLLVGFIVTLSFLKLGELAQNKLSEDDFDTAAKLLFLWPVLIFLIPAFLLDQYGGEALRKIYRLIFKKEKEND